MPKVRRAKTSLSRSTLSAFAALIALGGVGLQAPAWADGSWQVRSQAQGSTTNYYLGTSKDNNIEFGDDKNGAETMNDVFRDIDEDFETDPPKKGPGDDDTDGPWETETLDFPGVTTVTNTETGDVYQIRPPNPEKGRRYANVLNDYEERKKRKGGKGKKDEGGFLPTDQTESGETIGGDLTTQPRLE